MVVTEWQLDLDASLDTADDAATSAGARPLLDGHVDMPASFRTSAEREESHVALEIDPADEGASQP